MFLSQYHHTKEQPDYRIVYQHLTGLTTLGIFVSDSLSPLIVTSAECEQCQPLGAEG